MPRPYSFCHACGAAYPPDLKEHDDGGVECPQARCRTVLYFNAVTVPIVLQPIAKGQNTIGLLVIKRGKENDPGFGKWAYPGGFQGIEDWRDAAVRELREEVDIRHTSDSLKEFMTISTPDGTKNLKFCIAPLLDIDQLPTFVVKQEVAARRVIWHKEELAFPAHTFVCEQFFLTIASVLSRNLDFDREWG